VTIERTGATETIAGLTASKYRVLANDQLHEELWLTSDAALTRQLDLGHAPDTFGRMFACLAGAGSGGERVEASPEYRQIFAWGWLLKAVYHGEGGDRPHAGDARRAARDPRARLHAAGWIPPGPARRDPCPEALEDARRARRPRSARGWTECQRTRDQSAPGGT